MNKTILVITSLLGALAVVFGALGAHALKSKLGIDELKNFETGVKYQMFHVFAIFLVQLFHILQPSEKTWISILFLLGIIFFSGSLYVISNGLISAKTIWFITPLGGVFFIAGWLLMAWRFFVADL